MRRITGTHLYTYLKCAHAVALDFHEDPARRRTPSEIEEFVLARGRDLETRICADLDYATPSFADRDFDAGAAATVALMADGVAGISQGVLLDQQRLGIPDLLRREAGASRFGDHHYVVGDIKSSARPRSDQLLQILFYSAMLAVVQERAPDYAYLILKDGREERFDCADFAAVLDQVEASIVALRSGETGSRPFLDLACSGCRWSDVCLPELQRADDLSLLEGMTPGVRTTLEAAGFARAEQLREMAIEPTARRTHLEAALLRRLKKAATARHLGEPLREPKAHAPVSESFALVHFLGDAFADRVHYFAVLHPACAGGEIYEAFPSDRLSERAALLELVARLPRRTKLWHYGGALPRWYGQACWREHCPADLLPRMVDLSRRLRGAASYPGPIFGLHGHVQLALGLDPHRAGNAAGVAMWVDRDDHRAKLSEKGRSDLADMATLIDTLLKSEHGSVA